MEPHEPRSIIEAAEQSAAAGDYASAEKLLREAAILQEASLGPLHPDLANTLNNLGVVCEINNNSVDAEDCFRRAYAIATTALKPEHPFVATSRQNLRDFCEARGKQIELPTSEPEVTTEPEAQATSSADLPPESQVHAEPQDVRPVSRKIVGRLAISVLGPLVMLMVILAGGLPPSAIATDSEHDIAPQPAPASVKTIPAPNKTTRTSEGGLDGATAHRVPEASTPVQLTLVRARLCAELVDFSCDPPDRPVPAGPLFFYTEVNSTSATTIQHRWYRDNHLFQSVQLRVQASPRAVFRTYSRNIMTGESAGSWRVELRTEDGVLLHEERFSVR
jgi:hypothetical protein